MADFRMVSGAHGHLGPALGIHEKRGEFEESRTPGGGRESFEFLLRPLPEHPGLVPCPADPLRQGWMI